MRALCGAIITAGALIGLGLTALAIGTRYAEFARFDTNPNNYIVHWRDLDGGLAYALVFLSASAMIGLGIAFVGLAYHHERRHRERLHHEAQGQGRVLAQ